MDANIETISKSVSYGAFYMIVLAITLTLVIQILLRPKTRQEWGEFCKMLAFNMIVWRQVWTIATGNMLSPLVAMVFWSICFVLVAIYFFTLLETFGEIILRNICVSVKCRSAIAIGGLIVSAILVYMIFLRI